MARLPLSGDIGVFIVDADYNALQARSISDAEQYAREKAWAYPRRLPDHARLGERLSQRYSTHPGHPRVAAGSPVAARHVQQELQRQNARLAGS